MLTNVELLHFMTKIVVEQPKYCENMNVEKYAQRTGENIEINPRESPFKLILRFSLANVSSMCHANIKLCISSK